MSPLLSKMIFLFANVLAFRQFYVDLVWILYPMIKAIFASSKILSLHISFAFWLNMLFLPKREKNILFPVDILIFGKVGANTLTTS